MIQSLIRNIFFCTFIITLITTTVVASEAKGKNVFQAGAAQSNITPPLGVSLVGHMRDRTAQNVHDELYARSLALDDGENKIIMVLCDLIALNRLTIDKAKYLIAEQTNVPEDHILIACTHTHTGPTTVGVFQSDPEIEYLEWLVVRIADSAKMAVQNLQPARIGWETGKVESEVFNRRYFLKEGTMPENPFGSTGDLVKMNPGYNNPNVVKPAGPIDPYLYVMAVQNLEGTPIAVVGNYTLHYVGGMGGNNISADYFGAWSKIIEQEYGKKPPSDSSPFVAMLTNGCSGDINNINIHQRVDQPYPGHQMQKVARIVADEAMQALKRIQFQDYVTIDMWEKKLELGVRKPSPKEVEEAAEILQQSKGELKTLRQIYARETVLMEEKPETVGTIVQAIHIGDLAIATLPGEAFVELGLEIKEKSPFQTTFCVELANDYAGYIPTEEAHRQGGYETWRARSSFLAPDAATKMVSAVLNLFQKMKDH